MRKILFFGTPEYAVSFLHDLCDAGLTPVAVVTQPDRPVGRTQEIIPTPVKKLALERGIEVLQQENVNTPESIEKIKNYAPDLIVVVAFGQIISQAILDIPPLGCINVHPSLLPRHRGASPLQETLLQGDTETAVSIIQMDAKMDHGPLLAQKMLDVTHDDTLSSLQKKTVTVGAPLLVETIKKIFAGESAAVEQDHAQATYTRMLTREMGKLDFTKSAGELDRQIRALNPWPGTWTAFDDKRLKIIRASLTPDDRDHRAENYGLHRMRPEGEQLIALCAHGSLILDEVHLEGKNAMSGREFINGYRAMIPG